MDWFLCSKAVWIDHLRPSKAELHINIVGEGHYAGRRLASDDTISSVRPTTKSAVISAENPSITALADSTASRAEDTPVKRETTTKTFRGTRNRAES